MATATLGELLLPQSILSFISRVKGGRGPIASWLGFLPSGFDPDSLSVKGPNVINDAARVTSGVGAGGSLRYYTYRIFDHTRTTLKLRAPGTGPGTIAEQPMGQNTVVVARFHDKIPLNYERLGNLSPMMGPNSQIDQGGQNYITQMEEVLARKSNKTVEVMAAGMMRDSLYVVQVGDDWWPQFAAPNNPAFGGTGTQIGFQIPFQVPAGNKAQLNLLGAGNLLTVAWNNPNANLIQQLESLKAAYIQLHGFALTDAWINSTLWPSIGLNTYVRNMAGAVNKPFATYVRKNYGGMEGTGPEDTFFIELEGVPWLRWHTTDDVAVLNSDIDVSYSTAPSAANVAKLVPDNLCIFCTDPKPQEWCVLVEGGEYVVENPGMPGALRTGWYAWHEYVTQPSAIELIVLLNCVPALYIPTTLAIGTVLGF
mgnify:CR=1 FL=1